MVKSMWQNYFSNSQLWWWCFVYRTRFSQNLFWAM